MKKLSLILLTIAFVCTVSSCTKKSNCEMVEGHYVTGYFEYYAHPETANVSYIDEFNDAFYGEAPKGYLVWVDNLERQVAVGMIEKSIPRKYRKDGLRVPVNATYAGAQEFYLSGYEKFKLLCIEEVE